MTSRAAVDEFVTQRRLGGDELLGGAGETLDGALQGFETPLHVTPNEGGQPGAEAQRAFLRFKWNWQRAYPGMVRQLEQDLPELLTIFRFPRHLWRKLRTTNVIERCFVEIRRPSRPMVCFVNVDSVDRIIYAIFNGRNDQWRNRTLRIFTQAARHHPFNNRYS